jgi:HAE1 family hydrophobic/amphiphilic exporter-1
MSIVDIAIKRPVTISMFTFAVLLFGFVSFSKLSVNLLPELSYPSLTIRTNYDGAAPGEIEQLVSKPIEEAIGVVKGVRRVESISMAGQSDVLLEFEWGTDMDIASLEVREKLDILWLPLDVEKPILLRFNPSLEPIIRFGFGRENQSQDIQSLYDSSSLKSLRTFADEQIKRKLESVTGVASVSIGGGLENEIQVLVNQERISQLDISIQDIVARLRAENLNASGGRVKDGNQEYLVRTLNEFETLQEMRNLFIATRNGRNIQLGDVAEIRDAYKERTSVTRFNGTEGVEIAIYKEGDANTVQVAQSVRKRLERIKDELPESYRLDMVYDQSRFISQAIDEVKNAGLVGGILAMLVLYLFLRNIWPTLIISISIPVSIVATFNLMYGQSISLNIMSLGGIALAIGLLVDNAIVVLENIDRLKAKNKDIYTAVKQGTQEVSSAITASTLTTIAVFFPLIFVEGIAGQLFRDQALTVTFALLASLIVALTLIPMLASREARKSETKEQVLGERFVLKKDPDAGLFTRMLFYPRLGLNYIFRAIAYVIKILVLGISLLIFGVFKLLSTLCSFIFKPLAWLFGKGFDSIYRVYSKLLEAALKLRLWVLGAIVLVSMFAFTLIPRLGMELIPSMAQGEFFVEIEQSVGTQLDSTDAVLKNLSTYTRSFAEVERVYALAGTGSLLNAPPGQGGDHWGKLNVVLKSSHADQAESVKAKLREYLAGQPGVSAKFGAPELFSFTTPLEIEVIGYNIEELTLIGNEIATRLDAFDRFADIKSSLQEGNPELRIYFDHARLAQLGLDAPSVSRLVATKVGGEVASRFSIDDRKVDIMVRAMDEQRDSSDDIGQMIVNPGATTNIPLAAVATIENDIGPSQIKRVGQQRVVVISANLAYGNLGDAAAQAQSVIDDFRFPDGMVARVTGQNEEMQQSFNSLVFALALAVFLVYLVMASQFESLLHPFLILFTVPLAFAGSIYGLFITGSNVSVIVFIGLIMLAGIVVNNAIVLIDRINQLRARGMQKQAAILESASSRLRPILMTTLTTTLGLIPMAIGMGEGAEIRAPMAITVIFGLLFASILTLFLIPILYSLFDSKRFEAKAASSKSTEEATHEPV